MNINQLVGLGLLVLGAVLLFFGWQSSQAVDDQIMEAVTGRFTESTTWLFIGGVISAALGVTLLLVKRGQ